MLRHYYKEAKYGRTIKRNSKGGSFSFSLSRFSVRAWRSTQITHSLNSVVFGLTRSRCKVGRSTRNAGRIRIIYSLSGDPKHIKTKWSANAEWILQAYAVEANRLACWSFLFIYSREISSNSIFRASSALIIGLFHPSNPLMPVKATLYNHSLFYFYCTGVWLDAKLVTKGTLIW